MKTTLLVPVFFLISFFADAQDMDSTAIKQVDSLIQVSRSLAGQREFDKALEINASAEKIALEKLGRESASYGSCCSNHGDMIFARGDYLGSEEWYQKAVVIREKVLGKEHFSYARSLGNMGEVYMYTARNEQAQLLFEESMSIIEKTAGKESKAYFRILTLLAINYHYTKQYEKVEPLLLESKVFAEKVDGKESYAYIASISNLGAFYMDNQLYEKAEPFLLEAKTIQERVSGKEYPIYASILENLSRFYLFMGHNEKIEPILIEAMAIREKTLGKEHPDYARILIALANYYQDMGQYEKAEPYYQEAIAIEENVLGKDSPNYPHYLVVLANLYTTTGLFNKAEPLYQEALALEKKIPENQRLHYGIDLGNFAIFYRLTGHFEEAESLYLEALAYEESIGWKTHPYYIQLLYDFATLYEEMYQFEKAQSAYLEANRLQNNNLIQSSRFLSEQELADNIHVSEKFQNWYLSFVQAMPNCSPEIASGSYDNALFRKGFLLAAVSERNRLAASDSIAAEINNLQKSYHRRLKGEYSLPIAERDSSRVVEWENKANILEKELVRRVAGFAEVSRQVIWTEVQAALKPCEAALEFIHYQYWEKNQTDSIMYAALLLKPGTKQPVCIPLFEEKSLDSLLFTSSERRADYVNHLYTLADRGATPLGKPQKSLYELLWKPLEKELAGVKTIYFSPSGLLHRLNLAAIPIRLDSVLGDRYNLVELGSTRQLVIPAITKRSANDALLLGGIAYDADTTAIFQANAALDSISIANRGELRFNYTDSTLRVGTWNALPFTEREVGNVEKTLKAAGFQTEAGRGATATEDAFKTIGAGGKASPRVLHIATHGFFFPDPKNSPSPMERGLGVRPNPSSNSPTTP
ncbi:MAG: tetratricopeptide repeat protein [Lewinellaceae bacterium]|nr:tetratricopeptide repeat protein [Lewinellaceae bacterium]